MCVKELDERKQLNEKMKLNKTTYRGQKVLSSEWSG